MAMPPTIRVAHVIEGLTSQAGGPTTAFLALIDAAAGRPELQVRAFAPAPPADDPIHERFAAHPAGRLTLTPPAGRLAPGGLASTLAPLLGSGAFDRVHMHGLWCRDYLPIARAAERARVPVLYQPHGMLIREALDRSRVKKRVFLAAGLKGALARAGLLLFATEHEREGSWTPGAPPARVVPLPVEAPPDTPEALRAEGRARLEVGSDARLVVFLGRLHPVKRLELLIDAVARAPGAPLLALVGDGERDYARSLRARAEAAGLADRLRMPGWVSGRDKWSALAAGDALVLCSVHENFGYTAPEAAALGVPPVMTSNLSLADEIARAGVGPVADPTPESLAEAIGQALSDADAPSRARRVAWVRESFSEEAVGRMLLEAYTVMRA